MRSEVRVYERSGYTVIDETHIMTPEYLQRLNAANPSLGYPLAEGAAALEELHREAVNDYRRLMT